MAAQERVVMLLGAYSPTVQKYVWTNLLEDYRSGKVSVLDHFVKVGLPRAAIYRVSNA